MFAESRVSACDWTINELLLNLWLESSNYLGLTFQLIIASLQTAQAAVGAHAALAPPPRFSAVARPGIQARRWR